MGNDGEVAEVGALVGIEHCGAAARHLRLLDALNNTQGENQKILAAVVGTYLLRPGQKKEGRGCIELVYLKRHTTDAPYTVSVFPVLDPNDYS